VVVLTETGLVILSLPLEMEKGEDPLRFSKAQRILIIVRKLGAAHQIFVELILELSIEKMINQIQRIMVLS